jgi:N-sulfoglucosamine sulfohydrolase
MAKDPHQTKNLAADPAYAETLAKLRKQLMNELRENDDPRLDDDAFDRAPRLSIGGK